MPGDLGQAAGAASLPAHPATPSHTRPAPSLPLRGPLCLPLAPAPSPLLHHPSSSPHSAVSSPSSTPDVLVPRGVVAPARPPLPPLRLRPCGSLSGSVGHLPPRAVPRPRDRRQATRQQPAGEAGRESQITPSVPHGPAQVYLPPVHRTPGRRTAINEKVISGAWGKCEAMT